MLQLIKYYHIEIFLGSMTNCMGKFLQPAFKYKQLAVGSWQLA
jgi:hypothetical protein